MKFKLLFISLLAAVAMTACEKTEEAAKTDAPAAEQKDAAKSGDAAKPDEAAKTDEAAKPANLAATVPECEEFMKKFEACVNDKVPSEQRKNVQQMLDGMRASFDKVSDKAALAQACKQAQDQVKSMLQPMGCSF